MKALAAAATAVFAIIVLTGNPRRPANQFLAAYLALIAANQTVEALRAFVPAVRDSITASRLALIFAAMDPFFLYYFTSIYPSRNALNRAPRVALVLGGSALFAASWLLWTPQAPRGPAVVVVAWAVFTATVYTVALTATLRALTLRPDESALRLLYPALCVAALPAWPRVLDAVVWSIGQGANSLGSQVFNQLTHAGLFGVGLLAVAWTVRPARPLDAATARRVRGGVILGAAITAATYAHEVLHPFLENPLAHSIHNVLFALFTAAAGLRWLVFGALVSMAVLRYQMLGLSLRARRRAARVLVTLAFMGATVALLAVAHSQLTRGGLAVTVVDVAVLGVAFAATQGFHSAVDRVAAKVYGVPARADIAAALQTYHAAVGQAAREGRAVADDPELTRLRRELGLDARTAQVVEEMTTATDPRRLYPGVVVAGRYRVIRTLGSGGSGRAFLARDALLDRNVALKEVVHDGAPTNPALREARVAGSLNHPNVLTVYNVVELSHVAIIVNEHAPGGSLAERLADNGPLPPQETLSILDGVLAALEAVHAKGVVHRDLKPANILLTTDGTAKVADFGVARAGEGVTAELDAPGRVIGTPAYMAPEQRRGEVATPAADIYAAGLLLRRLLGDELPTAVEAVARRALQDAPDARWGSAAEMRAALRDAAAWDP